MEIAFAVVGVTDVAVRASSKLWQLSTVWRDAPADLYNLRDDLTRTERFFGEIQQHLKMTQFRGFPLEKEAPAELFVGRSELGRLVDGGAVALRRIEAILDGLVIADEAETQSLMGRVGELGKRRKLLWLRHSSKVARLRKELGDIRSSICRLLITQNISMATEIYTTLEQSQHQVRSQLSSVSLSLDAAQDVMLAHFDDRIQAMENRMLLEIQQDHSATKEPIRQSKTQLFTQYNTPLPYKPDLQADSLSPRRGSLCDATCTCTCHQAATRLWRLTLLRSVIGMVAVTYITRSSTPCTNPACLGSQQQAQRRRQCQGQQGHPGPIHDLYIAYHLPSWLARTSISAFLTTNLHGSPALNLRIYYRRSPEETQAPLGAGRLIDKGDVAALQTALRAGRTTIYDLHCETGQTALVLALNLQRPEVIKLYLQAGADPFHTDDMGGSVIALAFQLACSGVPGEKEMGELFPLSRYVDEADFTPLHRAVLAGVDLGSMLGNSAYKGDIDSRGGDGWTALHLAAMKGDAAAARMLIRAGANPDSQTVGQGVTSLYYACRYGHYEVAKVLLRGGADVHLRDLLNRQAIHSAGTNADAKRIIELLLRHGADVNSPGMYDFPPLMYAVIWGPMDAVEFLLEKGADPGGCSMFGDTMVAVAIRAAKHDKARMLLGCGADLRTVDQGGRNPLHLLATNGDEDMIKIFTGTELWKGVDTSTKDALGLTPLNLLNERDPSRELREAFDRLLDWVERCGEGDISDDEFFDAEDGMEWEDGEWKETIQDKLGEVGAYNY